VLALTLLVFVILAQPAVWSRAVVVIAVAAGLLPVWVALALSGGSP
jgi:hypothetical protein